MKISFYENVAKNTFINGIKEPYHSFLTHFELNDIEDYPNKCRRHDNDEQQANFLSYMKQRESKPKTNLFNAPSSSKAAILFQPRPAIEQTPFRPALTNFGNNNLGNNFGNNNLGNNFGNKNFGNNNFGNKNFGNKNFGNNNFGNNNFGNNNFGNNNFGNNNFRNNNFGHTFRQNNNYNQVIRQTCQPTPISISTRKTHRPGGNQTNISNNLQNNTASRANNFFRSTRPPNFVAEKLHHQEDQQNFVAHENKCQEEQPQKLVNDSDKIHDTENFQLKRDEINLYNHARSNAENFNRFWSIIFNYESEYSE